MGALHPYNVGPIRPHFLRARMKPDDPQGVDTPVADTWAKFLSELRRETDRGCAIVAAAYVDDLLGELLGAYLVENRDVSRQLLSSDDSNAPLGTFGSRILMAHAIGLIPSAECRALRKVKRIRNRFAHDLWLSFDNPAVSGLCGELAAFQPHPEDVTERFTPTPRQSFELAVARLIGFVEARLELVHKHGVTAAFSRVLQMTSVQGLPVTGQP